MSAIVTSKLNAAIEAVCPIHGVSIGRKDDKATWRIDFKDEATAQQRADAQAVVEAFDVAAAQLPDPRIVTDETERAACIADTAMTQVLNSTKADVEAWVNANFASMTALNRARFAAFIWLGIQGARARLRG